MFSTPVLFLIFNRPETAWRVFAAIRQAKPAQLFIAADGPRSGVAGEKELCAGLRQRLLAAIDWDCRVQTLFRSENLGCRRAVNEAIDWFFDQVEEGIILEDDCLPAADFFPYCQLMLGRYRAEAAVAMIGGTSLLLGRGGATEPYFFSKHFVIWGWATWRDRWQDLRADELAGWPERKAAGWLNGLFDNSHISRFYASVFDKEAEGRLDTWDIFWNYSLLAHDKLTVTPAVNLIANIGAEGLHAEVADRSFFNLPTGRFPAAAPAPAAIAWNKQLDAIQYRNVGLSRFSWRVRLRGILKRLGLLSFGLRAKRSLGL